MESYLFDTADDVRTSMHKNRNRDFTFSRLMARMQPPARFGEPLIGAGFASEALQRPLGQQSCPDRFLAPRDFWLPQNHQKYFGPIFGFPGTLEKGVLRLNLHFVGLPRSQKQGRRCRQTNPLCATDSPEDCRHFDVFHVTIEFPRIMGTEIFKKIYPCRKHKKRFPVDEKFIRHREPCQINYL